MYLYKLLKLLSTYLLYILSCILIHLYLDHLQYIKNMKSSSELKQESSTV